jgi:putative acyl-CoA dehydrogenase
VTRLQDPASPQPLTQLSTHRVENQPPPLVDYDAWSSDQVLRESVSREGGAAFVEQLGALGREVGSSELIELGREANRFDPELHSFDRFGQRIDEVSYHPAYHTLMRRAHAHRIPALPWQAPVPGAHVAHVALCYLFSQAESGVLCPIVMTYAVVPVLRQNPSIAEPWLSQILASEYDPRLLPAAAKRGVTFGMAMTEKQGGSDVRANSTRAEQIAGNEYRLLGHKWFCSAPMSDAFLTLARTQLGISCFLVPRVLPDGTRNRFFVQRLKDKLGNRSNASSEIEYQDTWAQLVGEEGRGVRTIMDMVQHTRLDAAVQPVALMRQALVQAIHHARHRSAFGARLIEQPLMRNVLADLALEIEAGVALALRVARSFDQAQADPKAQAFARIATALAKYWLNKRAPGHVAEALECLGGAGYVEESPLPRLYREAPLNGIWEGSGNVLCLDVLRVLSREPECFEAWLGEIAPQAAREPRLAALLREIQDDVRAGVELEAGARRLTERCAIALQAALLCAHAPGPIAQVFLETRVQRGGGHAYGTLPPGPHIALLIERAWPG